MIIAGANTTGNQRTGVRGQRVSADSDMQGSSSSTTTTTTIALPTVAITFVSSQVEDS